MLSQGGGKLYLPFLSAYSLTDVPLAGDHSLVHNVKRLVRGCSHEGGVSCSYVAPRRPYEPRWGKLYLCCVRMGPHTCPVHNWLFWIMTAPLVCFSIVSLV